MPPKDERAAILARRKYFISAALVGIATTGCEKAAQPCLNVAPAPSATDAGAPSAEPRPPDATTTMDAGEAPSPSAPPRVCLHK